MSKFVKMAEAAAAQFENGERAVVAIGGAYECKLMGRDSVRTGVLVATDRRVIFYAKKMFGFDVEILPYANISSIEMSKGMLGHCISLFTSGNKATMKWINWGDMNLFVSTVRAQIGKKSMAAAAAATPDPADQIRKLASLRDDSLITEEEFQAKKKALLGL